VSRLSHKLLGLGCSQREGRSWLEEDRLRLSQLRVSRQKEASRYERWLDELALKAELLQREQAPAKAALLRQQADFASFEDSRFYRSW
jgi:hypothetical protein